jgi:rare lipoprotein A
MPIFGLVWVASWVGCFFSSTQELLKEPSYLLPIPRFQGSSSSNRSIQASYSLLAQTHSHSALLQQGSHTTILPGQGALSLKDVNASSTAQRESPRTIGWLNALENLFVSNKPAPGNAQLASAQLTTAPSGTHQQSVQLLVGGFAEFGTTTAQSFDAENWSLQSFLSRSWHKVVAQVTPAIAEVVVVKARKNSPTDVPSQRSNSQNPSAHSQGFWRCPMPLKLTASAQAKRMDRAQIWVRGCLVAELPTESQARAIARVWQKALQVPNVDFSRLEPAMLYGIPGGRLGDRVLFTVPVKWAEALETSPEQLAINWINNFRIALKQPPLSQAQAQARLRGLVDTGEVISGLASWYGPYFDGKLTATGEIFNQDELTAAHLSLPFDTYLRVTNLENGKSVIVRINDRGPYLDDRVLDLSREAARRINAEETGVVPIEAVVMQPESAQERTEGQQLARRL